MQAIAQNAVAGQVVVGNALAKRVIVSITDELRQHGKAGVTRSGIVNKIAPDALERGG